MKNCFIVAVGMVALSASSAFAVVLENFESGWGGAGTLIADPADGGNTVLKLTSNRDDAGTPPDIFTIDTNGFVGKVSMDIYDFGATTWDGPTLPPFPSNGGTDNGPRWGIQGDADLDGTLDNWAAAGIIQKSFFNSNGNYAYINDNISNDGQRAQTFQSDWFSPTNFGNPRRVKTVPFGQPEPGNGIQFVGTGTPDSPQIAGSGAWTTWEFNIAADGKVSISALEGTTGKYLDAPYETDTVTQYNGADMEIVNMKQIWITGGHDASGFPDFVNSLGTHGVLIDNITFDSGTGFSPADFDTDGDVDSVDLATWQAAYGSSAGGDTNSDTDTDGADFLTWQQEYTGPGVLSGAASVPEPSTALLLVSGVLAMTGLATRKRG